MAWIAYQKAFDRVPHSWIIKSLELIGINNKITSFTKKIMRHWRTRMRVHTETKLIETEEIEIQSWNIARRLIITAAVLHLLSPPHRTIGRAQHGI
jgi:hypothetical protein